ncbi:MAG TPA: methyltransferase domain-containing protein [Candidatus Acidoferrum sp.]|nr:methyltransferase domain-containing protein [Candidatus Acidoferrum sp.]
MVRGLRAVVSDVEVNVRDTENLAQHAYSLIGAEYYDAAHITCRNFDVTVDSYLEQYRPALRTGSRYLEVGCGRSRLLPYSRPDVKVVLMDISKAMLAHSPLPSRCVSALLGSAFRLPFSEGIFSTAFAFLADPFMQAPYTAELWRTVAAGGNIVQIVPAYEWGAPLRASRQSPAHFSHFFRGTREAFGPSFLHPKADLIRLVADAGFDEIRLTDLFLPSAVPIESVSPDIRMPAELLGCSPYELPLLTVVEAARN